MYFNRKSILLILAVPLGIVASPIQEQSAANGWVEHYRETGRGGGSLIYFGPPTGSQTEQSETVNLQQRSCGNANKTPVCDSSHAARNGNCVALVSELYDNSDATVGESPRQICYQGDSDKNAFCCVSWHSKITGLRKSDLAPYASTSESTAF
ncbi:hypothetical protein Aspvir_006263 [Aspergillus viridinutans]|uniref:WD-like domain-containing protein n=1 Tax=Aspergillus viridinutans TaxID=75553 RepID=A0A9P3C1A2_ASPVI|nr:uncharacterized protein Aspvir_006263 [Aspergillus viridinutans]GIK02214.1 hypothetical protein Aspvir_006263 [Aspergillus viridinutans]